MSEVSTDKKLKGKDLITIGIFSAIYFVINFAFMLLGGIHPVLWMLMPGFIAVFAGIPFMLMVAKVQKPGAVFLMGLITALIYFATGQFTLVILISMASTCILAEVVRMVTKYNSFKGNSIAYVIFSLGMVGSPFPSGCLRPYFLAQITEQGMPADYVAAVEALSSNAMLIVLLLLQSSVYHRRIYCQRSVQKALCKGRNCVMNGEGKKHTLRFDPRTELLLLVLANIVAFTQHSVWVEITWVIFLLLLIVACGCQKSAGKLAIAFGICLALQYYVFPNGPKILASSFTIIVSYARKIFPCLIVGTMVLQKTPVRELMVALRKWHITQGLIIPLSVTVRYFPALKEETGYIRDAMKLRNIHGVQKIECLLVPTMISATTTAEELSAAAVTRGIENPAPKTSMIEMKLGVQDFLCLAAGLIFCVISITVG